MKTRLGVDYLLTRLETELGLEISERANSVQRYANILRIVESLRTENASLNERLNDEDLSGRAHQWQQLCDRLGIAHATHPDYIADALARIRSLASEPLEPTGDMRFDEGCAAMDALYRSTITGALEIMALQGA